MAEAHHQIDPRPPAYASPTPRPRPALRTPMRPSRGADTKPAPSLPQAYAPPTRRGQQACAKAFPHLRAARKPQSGQMRPAGARRLPRVCAPCGARTPCTDFVRQDKRDVASLGDTAIRSAGSLPADLRQLHTGAWRSTRVTGHPRANFGSMLGNQWIAAFVAYDSGLAGDRLRPLYH